MIDMISLVLKVILSIAPCASNWRCNVCKKVKVEHWEFLCKKIKEISEKKINTSNFSINDNISYQCRSFYPRKSRCQTHPVKKNELQSHQVFSEKLWTPISIDHSQVCVFKSVIAYKRAHSALLDSIIWDWDITT